MATMLLNSIYRRFVNITDKTTANSSAGSKNKIEKYAYPLLFLGQVL